MDEDLTMEERKIRWKLVERARLERKNVVIMDEGECGLMEKHGARIGGKRKQER